MKKKSIFASTLLITLAVFVTKILGVLKKSLIAAICGASLETDTYFIATSIMMLLGSVFFSSVSISLLSMYTLRLVSEGRESANNLMNAALRFFLPASMLIALVFVAGAPVVAWILAPFYSGDSLQLLASYIRLLAVMFVFICYFLLMNVVLETDKRFLPGKGYGFFQNVLTCVAVVSLYPKFGIVSLIYAFLLAGFLQCVQITWSARHQFRFLLSVKPEHGAIRQLLLLSLPLFIGNAIYEINDIVDKQIATGLGGGGVSFLSYGASINEMVTTLIISSVSTVMFSYYATWISNNEIQKVKNNFLKSINYLVILILPFMIMCFTCGDCIVDILYGRGNFDSAAGIATTGVVYGYAAGFLFQATRATIIRVYYAFQDTRMPMYNGMAAVCINIVLSLLLSRRFGVSGIAIATSISMFIVSLLLLPGLKKHIPDLTLKPIVPDCLKGMAIAVATGLAGYAVRSALSFGSVGIFLILGCLVVVMYTGLGLLFNISAVTELKNMLQKRLGMGSIAE